MTQVRALFNYWPEFLPAMGALATVTVNGEAISSPCCTPMGAMSQLFEGSVHQVEAGQHFQLVVDSPWQPWTGSIEMVHPAELTAPPAGAQISTDQDLEVTWTNTTPGEDDHVYLRVRVLGSSFRVAYRGGGVPPIPDGGSVVADGEARVTVPASTLQKWTNDASHDLAFLSPEEEVQWELVLSRVRNVGNGKLLELDNVWLGSEVATIPIAPLTPSAD